MGHFLCRRVDFTGEKSMVSCFCQIQVLRRTAESHFAFRNDSGLMDMAQSHIGEGGQFQTVEING